MNLEDMYLEYVRLCSERDTADRDAKKLFKTIVAICNHPMDYRYDETINNKRIHYCDICGEPM